MATYNTTIFHVYSYKYHVIFWCLMVGVMSSDISSCYKVGGVDPNIYIELLLG